MKYKYILQPLLKARYYFFAYLFFIEGIWLRIRKKDEPLPSLIPIDGDEQWIEEEEIKVSPKPAQSDVVGNQAKLAWSQIPKQYRKTVAWSGSILLFFLLFGIIDFICRATVLINSYPIIGWILLDGLCAYVTFVISKRIYRYFKDEKYYPYVLNLKITWEEAKIKAVKKYPF